MGILVSVSRNIFSTLPTSSAAIEVILNLSGIAGDEATVGCAAEMIGFAVMNYRENKTNELLYCIVCFILQGYLREYLLK